MQTKLKVGIVPHAVERYQQRLNKEHLTMNQAKREIEALMEYGVVGRPEWLNEARENSYGRNHAYITVDDVAFPARKTGTGAFILLSCITKGSFSPQRRKAKNKYSHIKRSKRGAGLRRAQGR